MYATKFASVVSVQGNKHKIYRTGNYVSGKETSVFSEKEFSCLSYRVRHSFRTLQKTILNISLYPSGF